MKVLTLGWMARNGAKVTRAVLEGESFLITVRNEPVAILRPIAPNESVEVIIRVNGVELETMGEE